MRIYFGEGEKEYFTFDFAGDRAILNGDNEPLAVVSYPMIHWFLPMNKDYLSTKKKIRKALFDAGFTYPEVTVDTGPDSNIRHIVFECEIEDEDELIDD